jgi:hypothetical protein
MAYGALAKRSNSCIYPLSLHHQQQRRSLCRQCASGDRDPTLAWRPYQPANTAVPSECAGFPAPLGQWDRRADGKYDWNWVVLQGKSTTLGALRWQSVVSPRWKRCTGLSRLLVSPLCARSICRSVRGGLVVALSLGAEDQWGLGLWL